MVRPIIFLCLVASVVSVCPRFNSLTNVNLPEYAGNWNVHGIIRTAGGPPRVQCLDLGITSNAWGAEPVAVNILLQGEDIGGNETLLINQNYPSTIPTLSRPGRWTVDVNGTQWEYSILATDYLEYGMSVLCHHNVAEDIDEMTVLFKSRYSTPMPAVIIDNYKNRLLPDYQIDVGLYTEISQQNSLCQN